MQNEEHFRTSLTSSSLASPSQSDSAMFGAFRICATRMGEVGKDKHKYKDTYKYKYKSNTEKNKNTRRGRYTNTNTDTSTNTNTNKIQRRMQIQEWVRPPKSIQQ